MKVYLLDHNYPCGDSYYASYTDTSVYATAREARVNIPEKAQYLGEGLFMEPRGCDDDYSEYQVTEQDLINHVSIPVCFDEPIATEPCAACGKELPCGRTEDRYGDLRYCGDACYEILRERRKVEHEREKAEWLEIKKRAEMAWVPGEPFTGRLQPGDIVVVNGVFSKGPGQVFMAIGFPGEPERKGEMSYSFKCNEPFPQVLIDLPNEEGKRSRESGVHMNGDDLKNGKVRMATEDEQAAFLASFPDFTIPAGRRMVPLMGGVFAE